MTFVSLPEKEYGDLITAADVNQIIANLEAIHDRVVDVGTGVDARRLEIVGWSMSVAGSWNHPGNSGYSPYYLQYNPTNYPDHTSALVICMGWLQAYTSNATPTYGYFDLHVTGTLGSVLGGSAGAVPIRAATANKTVYIPVTLIRKFDYTGVPLYMYPVMRLVGAGGNADLTFSGSIWYKEL